MTKQVNKMEDQVKEDTEEVAKFVKRYAEEFSRKSNIQYFVIGFLSAKGYVYSAAEETAIRIAEELWN